MRRERGAWPFVLGAALVVGAAAALTLPASGCGSGRDDSQFGDGSSEAGAGEAGPLADVTSLTISPTSADLVTGDQTTTATFTAQATFKDGTTRDVTSLVAWSAGPAGLLHVEGAKAVPDGVIGGVGSVTAFATGANVSATAPVRVKLAKTVVLAGAPAGIATKFGGTIDPGLTPNVVYPLDGAMAPPNLQAMEVQWTPPAGTSLFDLHVAGGGGVIDMHVYGGCTAIGGTGGCGLTPDPATWDAISRTLAGQDPGAFSIRAADDAGTKLGVSTDVHVQFATGDVKGGLYYFNTRGGTGDDAGITGAGIYRYDFDTKKVGQFFTQQQCAGCHALSQDGTKMLAPICTDARGCGRPLQLAVVDVATKQFVTPPMPVGDSDIQSWTPDNHYYVTTPACDVIDTVAPFRCKSSSGGVMKLIDATSNSLVATVPAGAGAMYPSFSNDGKRLVYARAGTYRGPLEILNAALYVMDVNAPTFGAETLLYQLSGKNTYHPSFSPDDQWVIYSQSFCEAGDPEDVCNSYNDPTARVGVVAAKPGSAGIDLANANGTGRLTNSWPKWAPFKNAYKAGDLWWFTMSSLRDYGFRTRENSPKVEQLWLVGFDPAKAAAGQDPSFAPVWLPFQETTGSNHIGQWTTKIVGDIR